MVECLNCGETYPPVSCRGRCPSCGLKDSLYDSPQRAVSGRKFKNRVVTGYVDDYE